MVGAIVGSTLLLAGAMSASSPCEATLNRPSSPKGSQVHAVDLLALREIAGSIGGRAPFSVSPDGKTLAIAVRQAVPETNSYCTEIVLVHLPSGGAGPIARINGNVALEKYDWGPLTDFSSGTLQPVVPQWSPDGRELAYLEEQEGVVQLMLYNLALGRGRQITQSPTDILDFVWNNEEINYSSRPASIASARALVEEGLSGYRYDERWNPNWHARPFPAPTPIRHFSVNLATGISREQEAEGAISASDQVASSPEGDLATIVPKDPRYINSPKEIRVSRRGALVASCDSSVCKNAFKVWWEPEAKAVLFMRRAGWGDSLTQIVRLTVCGKRNFP